MGVRIETVTGLFGRGRKDTRNDGSKMGYVQVGPSVITERSGQRTLVLNSEIVYSAVGANDKDLVVQHRGFIGGSGSDSRQAVLNNGEGVTFGGFFRRVTITNTGE